MYVIQSSQERSGNKRIITDGRKTRRLSKTKPPPSLSYYVIKDTGHRCRFFNPSVALYNHFK